MAVRGGFDWRAFFSGMVATLLIAALVVAIVVFGGLYPVAASDHYPGPIRKLLAKAAVASVERSASGLDAPRLTSSDIREGGSHFKAMCQQCHGGPGAKREEFASAMNPEPPHLSKIARKFSVAEIFWTAKHGIKMTGMPAFGKVDEDEELWKIAAFVKGLPNVAAADYESLPKGHEHEEGETHE